jgi:uncharacterized membrane protein YedE/YeeE
MFKFDSWHNLVLGLLTGLVFGFLLQRGAVSRYRVILGQFLWANHTMLRVMLTAVVVGAIGIFGMRQIWGDAVPLHVKSATILANAIGGIIFGVGMVILGYCPGTGMAAMGEGSRHAISGVLGMLAGAAIYAELHAAMQSSILKVADVGKVTFPDKTGASPWIFVAASAVIAVVVFALLHGRDQAASSGEKGT